MDIQAIPGTHAATSSGAHPRPEGPPPPRRREVGDSTEFSVEALAALRTATVPQALAEALADLEGERTNLAEDLQTLGEYFRDQPGGVRSLNVFMEARFSREDLDAFRKAAEAAGLPVPEG